MKYITSEEIEKKYGLLFVVSTLLMGMYVCLESFEEGERDGVIPEGFYESKARNEVSARRTMKKIDEMMKEVAKQYK
ncbi:hypothetical protein [Komagataeibacter sp. FNDCF1]|uniref:hypothetical protein n=1 Tax=Komagataeibacter sp. FNDCF1 TaxID=2878681 RepID=UPI001E51A40D|nr:hypothetical protein [Komagataeibacter sp. FNDCF1]MCE2566440.1 hypothetical protein [Komagataeibacter sp. FNDCF1]